MFWTAVVCGMGCALGTGIGAVLFLMFAEYCTNRSDKTKRAAEISEESVAALKQRNDIGQEQICALREIVHELQQIRCTDCK